MTITVPGRLRSTLLMLMLCGCGACSSSAPDAAGAAISPDPGSGVGAPAVPSAATPDVVAAVDTNATEGEIEPSGVASRAEDGLSGPAATTRSAPCERLAQRFATRLEAATGACRRDADCQTYPSGIDMCDGVTDAATARDLGRIAAQYFDAGCTVTVRCARHILDPVCDRGTCRNRVDL